MLTLNAVIQTQMMLNCPNLAVVPENTKKIHKLVLADHKLKLHEIAEELKILDGSVFTILHRTFVNEKAVFTMGDTFAHS